MNTGDPISRLNAALEDRYRIERELGEGGMATVYLADDLKHERKVALKVLKPELAAVVGAERFLAEIKTTANLQHPHILPLYDSGEADGLLFYVMPYVEGESLRERLDHEHQLPVDDAVRIATNLAEALDYAHRRGVVHRDIKPANVLLQDGKPVISDFGIALAVGTASGGRLTETGLSLGTPHYMSPEQATGDQNVGPTTDIYALGCVLYEMLVGEPPFTGRTAQAVLGKIITADLNSARSQRPTVPAHVDAVIRKAVEKVPADRFGSVGELATALSNPGFRDHAIDGAVSSASPMALVSKRVALGSTVLLVIVALLAYPRWVERTPTAPAPIVRFVLDPEVEQVFGDLAVAPDGSAIVYRGIESGETRLYLRRMDALQSVPIPGSDEAGRPFFSPDSEWLGFQAGGEMRKVRIVGGPVSTVASTTYRGATWGTDDRILFGAPDGSLSSVSVEGGEIQVVAEPARERGEAGFAEPVFLPNGTDLLFRIITGDPATDLIGTFSASSGIVGRLAASGGLPQYAETGHLLYRRPDGAVLAAPFDVERLVLAGEAVLVAPGVRSYGLASNGSFVFVTLPPEQAQRFMLVDEAGRRRPLGEQAMEFRFRDAGIQYTYPRYSPDGGQIALASEGDIWVYDVEQGTTRRLTSEGGTFPSWSPDGSRILFTRPYAGRRAVYAIPADGSGVAELLYEPGDGGDPWETALSTDGQWLAVTQGYQHSRNRVDITVVSLSQPEVEVIPVAVTPANERSVSIAPNGAWIAYVSNESGQDEVYVRAFPRPGAVWQVSQQGGGNPMWSPDSRSLYYRTDSGMRVARLDLGSTFRVEERRTLFDDARYARSQYQTTYDVDPRSGDLLMVDTGGRVNLEIVVVLNWLEELRGRAN